MDIVVNAILQIESPVFVRNGYIPERNSCKGENVSPELRIKDIPREAKTLALILSDADAPGGNFVHWVMWNIPVQEKIGENTQPGVQGKNSRGESKYYGACPPGGLHHYHFRVFALDTLLNLSPESGSEELMKAMEGHILGAGDLIGLFAANKE
jgi:Raf kinase inhibitor-like YbhB/YbcL family protein